MQRYLTKRSLRRFITWVRYHINVKLLRRPSIPSGQYCYSVDSWAGDRVHCPYWVSLGNSNAYCKFLKTDDWHRNEDIDKLQNGKFKVAVRQGDGSYKQGVETISAHDLQWSLLWDQVKECGVNEVERSTNERGSS